MKAIIMAGGEGSRLRPLTCDLPKPMVPVMNRPVMEYSIELLKKYGIRDVGVTLQYLPERIASHFEDGSKWDVNLQYFIEEEPLGTAGSVKNADEFLDETFIVISGDALTDINLEEAIRFHRERDAVATLVMKKVSIPLEYGVIITDEEKRITQFLEKPSWSQVFSDTVNTGIYILEPEILNYFSKGKNFDFSKDLFPILLKEKRRMFGYVTDAYWCDIGDLRQYLQAHYDVLEGNVDIEWKGQQRKKNIWVEDNAIVHEGAHLEGPCYIGAESHIREGASVYGYSVIGKNCNIYEGATIKRSVLWDQVVVKSRAALRGAVLCSRTQVHNQASVYEEAVVGENTIVSESSIIKPNVKIWPGKMIEAASTVSRNIIWGTRQTKTLFGECGVTGMINVDFTPEFATSLGAAYAATLKEGSKVGIASGTGNGSMMLKDAVKVGLLSEGMEVYDLGQITTPMARYGIRYFGLQGGIHIHASENDPEQAILEIMDHNGANISRGIERKIENLFARQDFKRAPVKTISDSHSMTDIPLFYMRSLVHSVNTELIKSQSPDIFIGSKSPLNLQLFRAILEETGCTVKEVSPPYPANSDGDNRGLDALIKAVSVHDGSMGVYIDENGEKISLIDGKGKVIQDDLLMALMSLVLLRTHSKMQLIIPLTAPAVIETMADSHRGQVIRTKTSRQSIMESLFNCKQEERNERIEMFNVYFDGMAGALKVIEFLAIEQISLSDLLKDIPEFHLKCKTVECPWVDKGKVIRNLIESEKENPVELLDGVKVNHNQGWALVLPDADAPLCRVYSEGYSEEYAESLSEMYVDKIQKIRKS